MTMKSITVNAPDKGINKYAPVNLLGEQFWADGNNVAFGPGYVKKVTGYTSYLNAAAAAAWAAATAYGESDYVAASSTIYKCTAAGISGTAEPTWPASYYDTVTDGTVTWMNVGVNKLAGVLMALDNYYKYNGDMYLMAVTTTNVYYLNSADYTFVDITGTALNGMTEHPVSTVNAEDYFVFTNFIDPVQYWDGEMATVERLPGLTQPDEWAASTTYVVGDYVRPVTETGFVYRCTVAGISGISEPSWSTSSSTTTSDGGVTWYTAGTQYAEGGIAEVRCKTLLYVKNFLLLGGTTEDGNERPERVRWSCIGDICAWSIIDDDAARQEAGYGDFTSDPSYVQDMRPIGDYVVVYKERGIQVMYYVGGTTIWNLRSEIYGIGLLATKAIVSTGKQHIFIGNENLYSFDLIEPKKIGDAIAGEFFRLLDPENMALTTGFYINTTPEVWFSFVSIDSLDGYPDKALTFQPDIQAWSIRDLPMTAFVQYKRVESLTIDTMNFTIDSWNTEIDSSSNSANSPLTLCGDASGSVYQVTGNSFNDAAIDCYVTSKLFDFGDPFILKRLLRIQLATSREGDYGLPVYVGTADNVDEDIVWYGPYDFALAKTYPPWVDVDITARYLCIKLGTANAGEPFKVTGYTLYYQPRGQG
ncbi:MAG: hypothetical protein H6Q74_2178 [Firmicutes bacterium]|nr:hypothetical protein [Bacillota bacterium]